MFPRFLHCRMHNEERVVWEMDSDGCTGSVCVFHSRFDFADAELCVSLGDMAGEGGDFSFTAEGDGCDDGVGTNVG